MFFLFTHTRTHISIRAGRKTMKDRSLPAKWVPYEGPCVGSYRNREVGLKNREEGEIGEGTETEGKMCSL